MNNQSTQAIVLAAGRSTRFNTGKNKLLTPLCGQPMILYPLRMLAALNIPTTVVVGFQAEDVKSVITKAQIPNVTFVHQPEQRGTGDAIACTQHVWERENILILNGDTPLLSPQFLQDFAAGYEERNATVSLCTTFVLNPHGYGRIVEKDSSIAIVEEKDCTDSERCLSKVNAGVYLVKRSFLASAINQLQKSSVTGEYYLTDIVALASKAGLSVAAHAAPFDTVRGVNTLEDLWAAEQIQRSEMIRSFMQNGVRFELAQNTHIDIDVEIGAGTFVCSGAHLLNGTRVGKNCMIGAFTILDNVTVGDECTIYSHTVMQDSSIAAHVSVGPFARLRNNVAVEEHAVVGNFVELKASSIGAGSKVKHHSYLGDTTVGKQVNIGAGTITCNHDGAQKHHTVIEDGAYVGSNNSLVAPVTIGAGAYTAAGSTITADVPANDLAIARARQENKPGYAQKLRARRDAAVEKIEHRDAATADEPQFMGALKAPGSTHELT